MNFYEFNTDFSVWVFIYGFVYMYIWFSVLKVFVVEI